MNISTASTEYIRIPVTATDAGAPVDLTDDPVEVAVTAAWNLDAPAGATWHTAEWETIDNVHHARLLIGPGTDVVLTDGSWDVWVRITDNPETPVLKAGVIDAF